MKKASYGDQFEKRIKEALKESSGDVTRLVDPSGGFVGVCNISDFIYYHYPTLAWVECKSTRSDRLNIGDVTKGAKLTGGITSGQYYGMLEKSYKKGQYGFVVIWFVEHDITAIISIKELDIYLKATGKKSINYKDAVKVGEQVEATKRIKMFNYSPTFIDDFIVRGCKGTWQKQNCLI